MARWCNRTTRCHKGHQTRSLKSESPTHEQWVKIIMSVLIKESRGSETYGCPIATQVSMTDPEQTVFAAGTLLLPPCDQCLDLEYPTSSLIHTWYLYSCPVGAHASSMHLLLAFSLLPPTSVPSRRNGACYGSELTIERGAAFLNLQIPN